MTNRSTLFLFFWFYLGWFGCVYFAKWNLSVWSYIFPLIPGIVIFKLKLFSNQKTIFLFFLSLFGILFDCITYDLGLIDFPNYSSFFIPHWLISIWFLFACVFPISQNLLKEKIWLSAALGAIFGPLSYFSGQTLHVLTIKGQFALPTYAVFWGLLLPIAITRYKRLK